ncbi:MAG: DNA polymerase III subunit delta' [Deltaproteobacteria bacterium]|nr:DNA polymerase III subunit delta' [Deltaproteobacteria bacterium]
MMFDAIIGQERPARFLAQMLQKRSIPTALLFTGVDGIGRQRTAIALGMALNCSNPVGMSACGKCDSCRKIISGSHPDIITVEPDGVFIKINQVRDISKQLKFAPFEGGWRIVIINDAQSMNLEASNAILKILEEPPKHTIFILTASQTTDLIPTIVSRCQQIAFRPIPHEKVAQLLIEDRGLDRQTARTLAISTKGSLGKALSMDAEKWKAWRSSIVEQISTLSGETIQPLFAFAETLSGDKNRLADALEMIMMWFRDVLISKVTPDRIISEDFENEIRSASQEESVDSLLEKLEAVHFAQKAIARNANARLTIEVMLLRLCRGDGTAVQ